MKIEWQSTVTCPQCGYKKEETMPQDKCQFFYKCTNCHAVLRPLPGDCCVFCSYGTVPCPPIQLERSGEAGDSSGDCCNTQSDLFRDE